MQNPDTSLGTAARESREGSTPVAAACEWCHKPDHGQGPSVCPNTIWKLDTEERREFVRFVKRTAAEWRASLPSWARDNGGVMP